MVAANVEITYSDYPGQVKSGTVKLDADKEICIKAHDIDQIEFSVKDKIFGEDFVSSFVVNYQTGLDIYQILQALLKQIRGLK